MLTVKGRADALATFRHVSVQLMETVAYWTPLTAEMEVKVMFGRHIWDYAQQADLLGKRTFELRAAEHYTRPPSEPYAKLLDRLRGIEATGEKLDALYEGIIPGLISRYEAYIAATDRLLDAPSVVIIERIVHDLRRELDDCAELRRSISIDPVPPTPFASEERAIVSIVA